PGKERSLTDRFEVTRQVRPPPGRLPVRRATCPTSTQPGDLSPPPRSRATCPHLHAAGRPVPTSTQPGDLSPPPRSRATCPVRHPPGVQPRSRSAFLILVRTARLRPPRWCLFTRITR